MTVLLALSTADRIGALALLCLAAALGWVAWYLRPRPAPPRTTKTVSIEITPRFTSPSRSHLRTLGPRPFDWSIDDPDLRAVTPLEICRAYDVDPRIAGFGEVWIAPVGTVVDETFPDGPDWTRLGHIADVDPSAFIFTPRR